MELEAESDGDCNEAKDVKGLRDPGTPTEKEIAQHCISHLPFRSWCAACVQGKSKDRPHRRQGDGSEKQVPEVCFDYGFLGTEGEEETAAVQVMRDRRSKAIFAHVVPRKGLSHVHGAQQILLDLEKLGHGEVILKSDGRRRCERCRRK